MLQEMVQSAISCNIAQNVTQTMARLTRCQTGRVMASRRWHLLVVTELTPMHQSMEKSHGESTTYRLTDTLYARYSLVYTHIHHRLTDTLYARYSLVYTHTYTTGWPTHCTPDTHWYTHTHTPQVDLHIVRQVLTGIHTHTPQVDLHIVRQILTGIHTHIHHRLTDT